MCKTDKSVSFGQRAIERPSASLGFERAPWELRGVAAVEAGLLKGGKNSHGLTKIEPSGAGQEDFLAVNGIS